MNRLFRLFSTSIGRKLVLAVTGVLLFGFLIGHILGNMAVFQGPDAFNGYANWLQGHPFVWVARGGLVVIFTVHIYLGLRLAIENRSARPTPYTDGAEFLVSSASRYMAVTGSIVLLFLVFHLAHFTFGVVDPEQYDVIDAQNRHDVYTMVVSGFQSPWVSGIYIAAMLVLGVHLTHAVKSLFQTLGINHQSYTGAIRIFGGALVAVIVLGNCSIPVLIWAGVITLGGN